MNARLRLEPGNVQVVLSPQAAHDVVLAWLGGQESVVRLSGAHLRRIVAAAERICPDCGGPVHDQDEVDQLDVEWVDEGVSR